MVDVVLVSGEVVTLEQAQEMACANGYATLLLNGEEIGCPIPVAPPIGFTQGPDLIDQVRAMVRREMALANDLEIDTPEDEEDFDHPEAFEPFTRHEVEGLSREELLDEALRRGMIRERQAAPDAPGAAATPSPASPVPPQAARPPVPPPPSGED